MSRSFLKLSIFICVLIIAAVTVSGQSDFENLLNSKEWQNMVSKGTVYLETGMYDKAKEYFQQVALTYPYIPEAQYYLGFVYYKEQDFTNSEKLFNRALVLDKTYVPALYYLGLIYHAKGDNEKSVRYFEDVTRYDPSFQSAYFNKGVSYISMQKPINAVKAFAYAVYLEPTDEKALEALVHVYAMVKQGVALTNTGVSKEEKNIDKGQVIVESEKKTNESDDIVVEWEDIAVSILNPGEKRIFLTGEKEEVLIMSKKGKSGMLEISFAKPVDLAGKNVFLSLMGEKGTERVKVTIKDASTRSCPKFYIKGITSSWQDVSINIEQNASMYIDTDKVKKIRLELMSPDDGESEKETRAFVKDIRIK